MTLEDVIREARGWLTDVGWKYKDVAAYSDLTVMVIVGNNIKGGWGAFVRTDPDLAVKADAAAIRQEITDRYGEEFAATLYAKES